MSKAAIDPAFVAIQAYTAISAACAEAGRRYCQADETFSRKFGTACLKNDTYRNQVWPFKKAQDAACDAEDAAMRKLFTTVPTTSAGLLALLQLVRDHQALADLLQIDDDMEQLINTLTTAASNLLGGELCSCDPKSGKLTDAALHT